METCRRSLKLWTLRAIIILMASGAVSCLSCSQCESFPGQQCMTSPPPSTPCESNDGNQANTNCMIARHLNDNGTLVFFSRGCTVVPVGDGCVPHSDNITLCFKICHYDMCNLATRVHSNRFMVLYMCMLFVIYGLFR